MTFSHPLARNAEIFVAHSLDGLMNSQRIGVRRRIAPTAWQYATMITISISAEAYEAIKATPPKNAETWPAQPNGLGRFRMTLPRKFVDRLGALRRPDESHSDVILRLAAA